MKKNVKQSESAVGTAAKPFFLETAIRRFDSWKAWIYLAPAIALLLVFTLWPIINTLRMAFWEDYSIMKELGGILDFKLGFKNFIKVIKYQGFIDCLKNTMLLTVLTVPLLSPMIAYVVITGFIGGFKEYSSIVGIFGEDMQAVGGQSLNTMVGYIYDALGNQEGRASAAALILFAIIFVVTMINMYVSKKKTHY